MRGLKLRWMGALIVACGFAASTAFAGLAGSPDSVRYRDRTGDSKLRLATRDGHVRDIVFHGDTVCRRANGNPVEPWAGTGVTSAFNDTRLAKSGDFHSRQTYRGHSHLVRDLAGNIESSDATVRIHFEARVTRNGPYSARCRTGPVAFKLHRVK
jgi:hypothetical protein